MVTVEGQFTDGPELQLVEGPNTRTLRLDPIPFLIGRSPESNLVLSQPFVSRRHAAIVREGTEFVLRDGESRHGTYVNGQLIRAHALKAGDMMQFGSRSAPELRFPPDEAEQNSKLTGSHDLLGQLQALHSDKSDLQKLRWFLQAARELNSASAVDRVMSCLLQTTLALAHAERGFVFLANTEDRLELASGMDAEGHVLQDGGTVSRTVMRQAIEGQEQFLITDTLTAEGAELPESIVANNIRAVICIPLRQHRAQRGSDSSVRLLGVLYLDSRFEPAHSTEVDHELMSTLAREAAALVENAQLAIVEEHARQHAEEMQIAAGIQQGLMAVQIPRTDFAEVEAHSLACSAVGGDFFDVLLSDEVLSVVLVDVSGKGISAAILASTLQGMLYIQLQAGRALEDIAASTNQYLCTKNVGKYATMVLARLHRDGELEYMNCGHVRPRMCSAGQVTSLDVANMPVGLIRMASYESGHLRMQPGSQLLLVSDGFTEAEDTKGEFFGDDRLDAAARCGKVPAMLQLMREFCSGSQAKDDCTIVQVAFYGA